MSTRQKGNVIFYILIAIVLVALLTLQVSKYTEQQSDVISSQTIDDEISRMQIYASTLGGALHQMIVNGEDPNYLFRNLDISAPGTGSFANGVNNNFKIFHPLGGGISYMAASTTGAAPMATNFRINSGAVVTGVGATDLAGRADGATIGDILFTAQISGLTYCQRINTLVNGAAAAAVPPVMTAVDFTALFTTGTAITVGADCTPTCANIPRQCVSNTGATAWGYYAALFPG